VPDDISAQGGRGAAPNDDVIVNGDMLGPEGLALLGALVGVVLEADGRGSVEGTGAQVAAGALVMVPVGWDYRAALWAGRGRGSGSGGFTSGGRITGLHAFGGRRVHASLSRWRGGEGLGGRAEVQCGAVRCSAVQCRCKSRRQQAVDAVERGKRSDINKKGDPVQSDPPANPD
jgi:hypothetical protein